MYKAGVALNRKSVFPLFRTTKVCGDTKRERKGELMHGNQSVKDQQLSRSQNNNLLNDLPLG